MINNAKLSEIISTWQDYLKGINAWQDLVIGITPKQTGNGNIYELPNPILRPQETFAIADMRHLPVSEPHYHKELEIYFVLHGKGVVVVGGEEIPVKKDTTVLIPSNTAHFTIPKEDLVLAVVNTPPSVAGSYIVVSKSNAEVKFDRGQFERLTS